MFNTGILKFIAFILSKKATFLFCFLNSVFFCPLKTVEARQSSWKRVEAWYTSKRLETVRSLIYSFFASRFQIHLSNCDWYDILSIIDSAPSSIYCLTVGCELSLYLFYQIRLGCCFALDFFFCPWSRGKSYIPWEPYTHFQIHWSNCDWYDILSKLESSAATHV